ncbi:hypothetical protein SI65_08605 [Aspergillus cristatus]|uniref:Retroviral polymerase SH3-like domain-containing protein n=1 Tax=Aspergillus cristatus TaxID=573508 RepID=A0A1E3B5U3_ASPCR|nr:hypothetical protein SI65_08605 [Aspergillus cristatus]
MAPRAWIGYLVGFIASNIWQIWSPRHQEVFNEQDVVFDESLFYDPDLPQPQDIPINLPPQVVETIQLPPAIREADAELDTEPTFDDLYEGNCKSHPSISHTEPTAHTQTNEDSSNPKLDHHDAPDMERNDLLPQPLMTPDHTPMPESPQNASQMDIPGAFGDSLPASPKPAHMDSFFIPSPSDRGPPDGDDADPDDAAQQLSTELEGSSNPLDAAGGEVDQIDQSSQSQNTAQRANEISADLDPRYIVSGKRKRNPVVHDVFAMCQINEEPCLFTGNGIILLVYVDNLLFVYHPDKTSEAERIASALRAQYELRYEGEGNVFLGVRIIRDRVNQVVHLNSTDYIKKIVSRFHMEDKHASMPAVKALTTYDGTASPKNIHHYQQKIGSINYAAITTRPDVAKIASHLATFMTNPGPEHFEAAN